MAGTAGGGVSETTKPTQRVALEELYRAMVASSVILIVPLPDGDIRRAEATEAEFGPACRRLTVYAMNEATYRKAVASAWNCFGVHCDWRKETDIVLFGRHAVLPILEPDRSGFREWRISLEEPPA